MDAVLTGALTALPQLGALTGLAYLVILLLRREGAELARERTAHDEDIAARDAEMQAKRERIEELEVMVDRERQRRRDAEDAR